jgi:hypothetical protein
MDSPEERRARIGQRSARLTPSAAPATIATFNFLPIFYRPAKPEYA